MSHFKYSNTFLFVVFSLLISGCTTLSQKEAVQPISIEYSDPNRIKFQGKGAGAGIALMSTMGSMGIALGVAIDEGIAKDIRESAQLVGFSIDDSVREALTVASDGRYRAEFAPSTESSLKVVIKNYGFKSTGGKGDPTSAKIEVEVVRQGKDSVLIRFPEDFDGVDIKAYPLERLKNEGGLAKELLGEALVEVFGRVGL